MNDIGAELAEICEQAAALILPLWRTGLAVAQKADESPVTEADRQGEALILKALAERFPDVPVISEEDASEFGTPDAIGPRFFLVDPLDGTKAFVRGDPNFTVNIGLIQDRRPVAGAVVAPPTGECWFTQGGGAMKRVNGGAATS
ncbi:MAG: inositol monophosphatase family protein, partial [Phenylobacterium sp.]